MVTAASRGVAALLKGCVNGTDHDKPWSSTEPGHKGSLGVAALILGTLINALHAISAASLLITFVPEMLSKVDVSANDVFINWAGSVCHTLGPKGGGNHRTGTAGISVDGCSCNSPVGTLVSFGGAWVFFIVLGKGLPIPGIDFFEDFPLLTLVVANLELVNSFTDAVTVVPSPHTANIVGNLRFFINVFFQLFKTIPSFHLLIIYMYNHCIYICTSVSNVLVAKIELCVKDFKALFLHTKSRLSWASFACPCCFNFIS